MKIGVLFVALLLVTSCAPLRPLGPQKSTGSQAPQTSRVPQTSQTTTSGTITGMDDWDRVLSPWLGTPYLYGGNTKKGTDCSGFVSSVYMEKERISLPRTTTDGYKMGKSVDKSHLAIGDLIYFGEKRKVSHVGIFVGNGSFIHASTSLGVTVTPLEDSY